MAVKVRQFQRLKDLETFLNDTDYLNAGAEGHTPTPVDLTKTVKVFGDTASGGYVLVYETA